MVLSLTWVILGGGQGARLGGVQKPLLEGPDGRTLLEAAIAAAGTSPTLVVAPKIQHLALAEAGRGARLVDDPGAGPAVALSAALPEVSTEWLALVAADHPRHSAKLVERLCLAAQGFDAAVVIAEGRDQPFPGVYRKAALMPERSLQALLAYLCVARIPAEILEADERAALEDVDLPDDLRRLGVRLAPGAGPLKD